MKRKSLLWILLLVVFIVTSTSVALAAEQQIKIFINGGQQVYTQPPVVINGSTLVPMRGIFESLGATVNWDGSTKTVTAKSGNTTIVLKIGTTTAKVNNQSVTLAQAARVINGSTMVPLRFVSESLGAKVDWNGQTRVVTITQNTNAILKELNNQLVEAIKKHDANTVKSLLAKGASPNYLGEFGTPLMAAVRYGTLEIVNILLDGKADIQKQDPKGWTALMHAASGNKLELAQLLLAKGAKLEAQDLHGTTALMYAADQGHSEMVAFLLKAGANPNLVDNDGWNALMYGVIANSVATTEYLLDAGSNPNQKDKGEFDGITPLMKAAEHGNVMIMRLLVTAGATIDQTDNYGWTPLYYAVTEGYLDAVKALVDYKAAINIGDSKKVTPLMYAIDSDEYEVTKYLLELGASIHSKDVDNWTPIIFAAYVGNVDIINLLIEHGANVQDVDKSGINTLMLAAISGDVDAVNLFLNRGLNPNQIDNRGWNALNHAANWGQLETVKLFIQQGVFIDSAGSSGTTPLMIAAQKGHKEVVEYLIQQGADIHKKNTDGRNALFYAVNEGQEDIVRILVQLGLDPNEKEMDGSTTLMYAAYNQDTPMISLLLSLGADPNVVDDIGWNALMSAADQGQVEVAKLLIDAGSLLDQQTTFGDTALIIAAEKGYTDFVKLLLAEGVNLRLNNQGEKAKYYAGQNGFREVVEIIEEAQKNIISGYKLSTTSTNNSMVQIEGTVDPQYKWVLFNIKNEDKLISKQVAVQVVNGRINETLYLNLGAGKYTIFIYKSEETEKYTSEYYFDEMLRVSNSDLTSVYLLPSEMVESNNQEIIALAQSITEGLTTDFDKAKAIHNWVAKNIRYDTQYLKDGTPIVHSALETLNLKLTDCDGYSRLTAALLRAVGIKAKIVGGATIDNYSGEVWGANPQIDHAWNEAYIDGQWIIIDTTWDAGYVDNNLSFVPNFSTKYFNPSKYFFEQNHKKLLELVE